MSFSNKNMINEELRLAYLAEMQVTSWELREPFKIVALVDEEMQRSDDRLKVEPQGEVNLPIVEADNSGIQNSDSHEQSDSHEKTNSPEKPDFSALQTKKNQFLNLVNWSSDNYTQSALVQNGMNINEVISDKNILIICRHKVDQPANSFANRQTPSRFMQDYLKSLVESGLHQSIRINIQLAHLSEAGLGKSSIKIETYYEEKQPDITLVLGDETVVNLIDQSSDVKNNRCRLKQLIVDAKAIVSYHPFDLISNPRLKSLAYEDIQFLINTLGQHDI